MLGRDLPISDRRQSKTKTTVNITSGREPNPTKKRSISGTVINDTSDHVTGDIIGSVLHFRLALSAALWANGRVETCIRTGRKGLA